MKYLKTYNRMNEISINGKINYNDFIVECNTIHEKKALQDWMFNNGYIWNNCTKNKKLKDNCTFWTEDRKFIHLVKKKLYHCVYYEVSDDEYDEYVNDVEVINVNDLPGIDTLINAYKMDLL